MLVISCSFFLLTLTSSILAASVPVIESFVVDTANVSITIRITGKSFWYGLGFFGTKMADATDYLIIDYSGSAPTLRDCHNGGDHVAPVNDTQQDWVLASSNGNTLVVHRRRNTGDSNDTAIATSAGSTVPYIAAVGTVSSGVLQYHSERTAATVVAWGSGLLRNSAANRLIMTDWFDSSRRTLLKGRNCSSSTGVYGVGGCPPADPADYTTRVSYSTALEAVLEGVIEALCVDPKANYSTPLCHPAAAVPSLGQGECIKTINSNPFEPAILASHNVSDIIPVILDTFYAPSADRAEACFSHADGCSSSCTPGGFCDNLAASWSGDLREFSCVVATNCTSATNKTMFICGFIVQTLDTYPALSDCNALAVPCAPGLSCVDTTPLDNMTTCAALPTCNTTNPLCASSGVCVGSTCAAGCPAEPFVSLLNRSKCSEMSPNETCAASGTFLCSAINDCVSSCSTSCSSFPSVHSSTSTCVQSSAPSGSCPILQSYCSVSSSCVADCAAACVGQTSSTLYNGVQLCHTVNASGCASVGRTYCPAAPAPRCVAKGNCSSCSGFTAAVASPFNICTKATPSGCAAVSPSLYYCSTRGQCSDSCTFCLDAVATAVDSSGFRICTNATSAGCRAVAPKALLCVNDTTAGTTSVQYACLSNCSTCTDPVADTIAGMCVPTTPASGCFASGGQATCIPTTEPAHCVPPGNCSTCTGKTLYDNVTMSCLASGGMGCQASNRVYCSTTNPPSCVDPSACSTSCTGFNGVSLATASCALVNAKECRAANSTYCTYFTSISGHACLNKTCIGCAHPVYEPLGDVCVASGAYCNGTRVICNMPGKQAICVSNCSAECGSLTTVDQVNRICVQPSGANCNSVPARATQYLCRASGACVSNCSTSCLGNSVHNEVTLECAPPSKSTCIDANMLLCATASGDTCVQSCSSCRLSATDALAGVCVAPSADGCAANNHLWCPITKSCLPLGNCSSCSSGTTSMVASYAAGSVCVEPFGLPPSGSSGGCWQYGRFYCPVPPSCVSSSCADCAFNATDAISKACVAPSGSACKASSNQYYCPSTSSCVASCGGLCAGYPVSDRTGLCGQASPVLCREASLSVYCPSTRLCTTGADCTGCSNYTAVDPVINSCVLALATGCSAGLMYCNYTRRCESSCNSCVGSGNATPLTASAVWLPVGSTPYSGQCVAPSGAGCRSFSTTVSSEYFYCSSTGRCETSCLNCGSLTAANLQTSTCIAPNGTSCYAASGAAYCSATSSCVGGQQCSSCGDTTALDSVSHVCVTPFSGTACLQASGSYHCSVTGTCIQDCSGTLPGSSPCPGLLASDDINGICVVASGDGCYNQGRQLYCSRSKKCVAPLNCTLCDGLVAIDPLTYQCVSAPFGCAVNGGVFCPVDYQCRPDRNCLTCGSLIAIDPYTSTCAVPGPATVASPISAAPSSPKITDSWFIWLLVGVAVVLLIALAVSIFIWVWLWRRAPQIDDREAEAIEAALKQRGELLTILAETSLNGSYPSYNGFAPRGSAKVSPASHYDSTHRSASPGFRDPSK